MQQILQDLSALIVPFAKDFVAALVVFFVGFKVVNVISKKIKNGKILKHLDRSAATFIGSFVSIFLKIVVVVSVIAILGVPMSSVVALIASAGVAIGLAVQGALSNLVGGLMILIFRPFRVGDYVEAEGASGTVKEIKLFSVKIVTGDNLTIVVPNNTVFGSTITNYSQNPTRRLDLVVPVAYGTNVEQVKTLLLGMVNADARVAKDPAPFCRLTEWADSSLNFTLRVWVKSGDFWAVKFDLLENILAVLEENHIEIPYNIRFRGMKKVHRRTLLLMILKPIFRWRIVMNIFLLC